ncbi:phage shock protein operon transcriptional activator [Desulfocicer niacini]
MNAHPYAQQSTPTEALGQSEAFLDFQERLSRVAPIERPVLILGERGTGKELAAARLHFLSLRWQGPRVTLNCASLAPSLVETELFGHEKGSFTGALQRRTGRFEAAHKGTLFLDEIGTVPMEVQEKILRVVEYGEFERVGGSAPLEVDVRIVSATNADLPAMARQGRFKEDLLDRLSFEVLFVPPLRERKGDVPLLARHFAVRMSYELGRDHIPEFSRQAMEHLESHPWHGNVRELKNVVERAVYRARGRVIHQIVFDPFISPYEVPGRKEASPSKRTPDIATARNKTANNIPEVSLPAARDALEISLLKNALESTRYNKKKAAKQLGISYDQLRGLYRKHKVQLLS